MERYKTLSGLAIATLLLGSCVYVPPPEYYGGPPPPDAPYHYDGPPPPDMYYGRGRPRMDYDTYLENRRRGRTDYLRNADPDYAVDDPVDGPMSPESIPPDDVAAGNAPPPRTETAPAPERKIDPATVPYATRANTPGRAKSPYPPYRELDVSGMKSGSMAKDPTTGKLFRVP